jgi:hypothetical protein
MNTITCYPICSREAKFIWRAGVTGMEMDSLFVRFGTSAPYSTIAHIEQLCYNEHGIDYIWDYDVNPSMYSLPLAAVGDNAVSMFNTYNTTYPNLHIGIWNRLGDSRTIASSFNLGAVYSDTYDYKDFLAVILDTLNVYHTAPVAIEEDVSHRRSCLFPCLPILSAA